MFLLCYILFLNKKYSNSYILLESGEIWKK